MSKNNELLLQNEIENLLNDIRTKNVELIKINNVLHKTQQDNEQLSNNNRNLKSQLNTQLNTNNQMINSIKTFQNNIDNDYFVNEYLSTEDNVKIIDDEFEKQMLKKFLKYIIKDNELLHR